MKGNNMDFVTRYNIFQRELYNAFLILIENKGENGAMNLKGLSIIFDGVPIAFAKNIDGSLYFITYDEEYYGFFSGSLKDMCRLYDDIAEVLK